jgi:transcriptional regulator GlxA family with amidase domain
MLSAVPAPRVVVLIGYDGVQSLDLTGPMEVFTIANRFAGAPAYDVFVASLAGGEIVSNAGLRIAGVRSLSELPQDLDTILVAGGETAQGRIAEGELGAWLRERATRTRRIGSVCDGALVLAAAGLLDGRRATTHWKACDLLAARWPAVRLEPDAIFVADPPFYTSAGITAGMDLCLSLVEADLGGEVALAVARHLVLFMRRPGGQSQYSAVLKVKPAAPPRIASLIGEITANPTGDLSLPSLAARAGMSERTFVRRFHEYAGETPAAFVEMARIDCAKALLERSDWPLARIAERAGFGSLDALHRAFRKRLGATPSDYRARFGHTSRA